MKSITPAPQRAELTTLNDIMHQAGQVANDVAARRTFDDHTARKADNTVRRKIADLALFETFLRSAGVPAAGLFADPHTWSGVTWGLVEAFKAWQLQQGYAIGSINGRLSTVRTYAKLAAKAGAITPEELRMISTVEGYAHKEARNVDAKRRAEGLATRKGAKKPESVTIPADIADALKAQPDTPQGHRDALLMCLLLDHGLRVGEVAILTRQSFDLKAFTFTFLRPKVDIVQTHKMTADTRRAAVAYIAYDAPAEGILWRRSCKGTSKLSSQLSAVSAERAITKRVEFLGRKAGIEGLSAHDCRHFWATYESQNETPIERLKDAGGWSSLAMPMRYIKAAQIANVGTARLHKG